MKWFQNRLHRACAVWLAAAALPSVALAQGAIVTPTVTASDQAVAERMARAQRVANDPLRRIQEAARLGGGPGKAGTPAAAAAVATAAASAAPAQAAQAAQAARRQVTSVRAVATAAAPAAAASAPATRPVPEVPASVAAAAPALAAAVAPPPVPATGAQPAPLAAASIEPRGAEQAAMAPQAVAALSPRAGLPAEPVREREGDAPKLLEMVEPDFGAHGPRDAGVLRFQVRFSIAADGRVTDVVVQGSAERALQRAVRDAVSRWRYAPPAKPMPHSVDLVVRFEA